MGALLFRHRLPAMLAAFVVVLAAALTQRHWAGTPAYWNVPVVRWPGVNAQAVFATTGALCVVAFLLRVAAEARLRAIVYGQTAPKTVVTAGPFGWLRNPLYAGTWIFFVAAAALWLPVAVWLGASIAFFIGLDTVVRHEEKALQQSIGDDYARYMARVRRWIPTGRLDPDGGARPSPADYRWAILGNLGLLSLGLFRISVAGGGPPKALGLVNAACILLWLGIVIARRLRFARTPAG